MKRLVKCLGLVLLIFILLLGTYMTYLFLDYHRIEDKQKLRVKGQTTEKRLTLNKNYQIATYNIGFGAYRPDFSFFMDGGQSSWAKSKASVVKAVTSAGQILAKQNVDFALFQEVDLNGTRSYHVNQYRLLSQKLPGYNRTFALNYDSSFLFYPLTQPHGKNRSGIATYSRYPIRDSLRRSLPISTSFSKFFDLDRAYVINHIPITNGKQLALFNLHLSAYGNSATVRSKQLAMLKADMEKERAKGNYVIVGGDFNHDLKASKSEANRVSWAHPFPRSQLTKDFSLAIDDLDKKERTNLWNSARNTDAPYVKGKTYTVTLDGFIISNNIKISAYKVIRTNYAYSDHEPVQMTFQLLNR